MKPKQQNPEHWPDYMAGRAVARWTRPDNLERVFLIAHLDGNYWYGSMELRDSEYKHRWVVTGTGGRFFGSEELAINEIQATWPWTQTVRREDRPPERSRMKFRKLPFRNHR